jgi:hypothetical protein
MTKLIDNNNHTIILKGLDSNFGKVRTFANATNRQIVKGVCSTRESFSDKTVRDTFGEISSISPKVSARHLHGKLFQIETGDGKHLLNSCSSKPTLVKVSIDENRLLSVTKFIDTKNTSRVNKFRPRRIPPILPISINQFGWIKRLKEILLFGSHNVNIKISRLSISAANNFAKQLNIKYLDEADIDQVLQSIVQMASRVYSEKKDCDNYKSPFLKSLTKEKLSLEEKVDSTIFHSLQFISFRNELLKDALRESQVSQMLTISPETIRHEIKDSLLLAVNHNGELYFPIWQFDRNVKEKLPSILKALDLSDLGKLSWLTNSNSALEGRKPFEILRDNTSEDDKQRVLSEAYGVGRY